VRPESHDWAYGFGGFDPATKKITEFTSIAAFDGKAFRGQAKMPDGKAAAVMVDALGGNAGPGTLASSIRRWVAPLDGKVTVMAELAHADNQTAGVVARVVLTRPDAEPRVLGEWQAHGSAVGTAVGETEVCQGDTLDFVVTSQSEAEAGPYEWSPMIRMPGIEMPGMPGVARRWDARTDYRHPIGVDPQPIRIEPQPVVLFGGQAANCLPLVTLFFLRSHSLPLRNQYLR
jgi:hypothetical protein